ncbi:hypothetical protein MNBD_GAMMA17-1799 [hydrothermal vent metagenome]|uniref:Uncharacterized protein n=1 Tax=hydrothermal vent metagenome TaxID=652676 RepID=A0A3B0ZG39_9ZZZZ
MMGMMIEAILVAFTLGGVIGAAVAVHLKSSTDTSEQWSQDTAPEDESLVYVKEEQRRQKRR